MAKTIWCLKSGISDYIGVRNRCSDYVWGRNEMNFTTNNTAQVFIIIVALLGFVFGGGMMIASYPRKILIGVVHKKPIKNIDEYYFYYQKATAYRLLFNIHVIFMYTFKILGSTMTFITVYCAINRNEYILLCSLIAAMCEVVSLIVPTDKYIKIYVQAARLLEYELFTEYENKKEEKINLIKAYKEAERIIAQEFV